MRTLIALTALILLSIFVLGCPQQQVDDGSAGRYHLRERVGDFFGRGPTEMLAGRYHTRTRVDRFFDRGAC